MLASDFSVNSLTELSEIAQEHKIDLMVFFHSRKQICFQT
jgi:hypothetical protein